MELKDYSLSDEIKKQLGIIIREERKKRLIELKNEILIENNPYTKENFCENNVICHYHTLTKLENDIVKEDQVYHMLLQKLDFYFQVSPEEHEQNLANIVEITKKTLYAGEYIDDVLANKIKDELDQKYYENDIIAEYNLKLLRIFIKLQLVIKLEDNEIDFLINFNDFYQGIFQGVSNHCLGIYYLNRLETEDAQKLFLKAKKIYDEYNISKGLISSYLIAVYNYTNNYYESVPLCNEMETYYKQNANYKRLMHVYNYLSDYYFLINAVNIARDYFNKAIEIIDRNETLLRFKYSVYYNWAYRCFKVFKLEESLENFLISLSICTTKSNIVQIINFILIIMTKLGYSSEELIKYWHEGEKYIDYSNESNVNILKYFRFKLKKSKYYRKFAFEKILPMLSDDYSKTEILLFFYEDLYK